MLRILLIAIGFALLVPAPVALVAPELAATAYGITVSSADAQGYLIAIAIRDVALGVWLLAMIALRAQRRLLAASVWSIGIVAVGDALNVGSFAHWQFNMALAPHIAGVVVLSLIGCLLWREPANSELTASGKS